MSLEIIDVARMASVRLQDRFIVGGTKEGGYWLSRETLDLAVSRLEWFLGPYNTQYQLTHYQRETLQRALDEYLRLLEKALGAMYYWVWDKREELVRRDPAWQRLRELALECVRCMDFDLEAWEQEQLMDTNGGDVSKE